MHARAQTHSDQPQLFRYFMLESKRKGIGRKKGKQRDGGVRGKKIYITKLRRTRAHCSFSFAISIAGWCVRPPFHIYFHLARLSFASRLTYTQRKMELRHESNINIWFSRTDISSINISLCDVRKISCRNFSLALARVLLLASVVHSSLTKTVWNYLSGLSFFIRPSENEKVFE